MIYWLRMFQLRRDSSVACKPAAPGTGLGKELHSVVDEHLNLIKCGGEVLAFSAVSK